MSPTPVRRPVDGLAGCQAASGRVLFTYAGGRAVVVDRRTGGVLADTGEAARAALSPDGRWLGVLGDREVRLWGGEPFRPVRRIDLSGAPPRDLAFSPDGLTLAVATGYGAVLLDLDPERG
jgi:hypothetical protein